MQQLLTFALVPVLTSTLLAAMPEWSQWRGPNRDGRSAETGLLKKWPASGPRLSWKATELGGGYGGISASESKLFALGDS